MCDFFPFSRQELENADFENADFLFKLDSHGLFPAPDENTENFRTRLLKEYDFAEKINSQSGKITLWQSSDGKDKLEVNNSDRIDKELFVPAWEMTGKLYDFAVDYVPGFYLFDKVGLLWGGCSIYDDETEMKVFLLRPAFKNKKRFLIYGRNELIAHELCHCARQVLHDNSIEEYFAYQTSKSKLRRYIGNCFIRESDALLFLLPSILLLLAQIIKNFLFAALPLFPFWIFLAVVLLYFLIRNQHSRNIISKAGKKLSGISTNPDAVLFRSTLKEAKIINSSFEEYFEQLSPMRKTVMSRYLRQTKM